MRGGFPFPQTSASASRAFPMLLKGEASQALPWFERAVRLSEANGLVLMFGTASSFLGSARVVSRRPGRDVPHRRGR
jgi:hypothetical protein